MKPVLRFVLALAVLGRVSMAPFTISVPLLGALASGIALTGAQAFGLALVGCAAHFFGFGLNDLIDAPLDRTLALRSQHPLATGALSARAAWGFVLIQIPLCLLVYVSLSGSGLPALILSGLCSAVYNLWSKWGRLPRWLPEAALAASTALLCAAGSLVDGEFSLPALLYALALGLVLLLLNSVSSGLKDIRTDAAFGARSFVLSTGSRMLDADRLYIAPALRLYSAGLQGLIFAVFAALILLYRPPALTVVLMLALAVYGALHLRMLLAVRSFAALRGSLPLLNGFYNYGALLVLVAWRLPAWLQIAAALYVLLLLATPLRLSFSMWRKGYAMLRG